MSAVAAALRPADAAATARALADAARDGQTVRIRGAGTKDYLGELLPTDLVLETTALRGVVAHVPADLTVTVAAGTTLSSLRATLAAHGQMLPVDPPHSDRATIGGIVAAGSSGFRRARYGGIRDLLIGTQIALTDGTLARSGGRVVKNVAGYDLNKLFIGSLGTLGVLTECTFKILPLPASTRGLRTRFRRATDAFGAADVIARTPARPAALVVDARSREEWELLVSAEGDAASTERVIEIASDASVEAGVPEPDDEIERALAEPRELPAEETGLIVRASLPPAALTAFAETAFKLDRASRLVADAASGIVRVLARGEDDVLISTADTLLAAARACGGSARVERRPVSLRGTIAAWGDGDLPGLFLMKRIRAAFDPDGILEPGRGAVR